jgi:hypothetical protein
MLKKAWLDLARQFHEVAERLEGQGSVRERPRHDAPEPKP